VSVVRFHPWPPSDFCARPARSVPDRRPRREFRVSAAASEGRCGSWKNAHRKKSRRTVIFSGVPSQSHSVASHSALPRNQRGHARRNAITRHFSNRSHRPSLTTAQRYTGSPKRSEEDAERRGLMLVDRFVLAGVLGTDYRLPAGPESTRAPLRVYRELNANSSSRERKSVSW
jgi:hypothetical protein